MSKKPWWLAALTGDPFISGLSYLLFGGNGTDPEVKARTEEQAAAGMSPGDRYAPDSAGVQGPGWFSSLVRKYTGSGLTGAEQEQNLFNAEQAQLDWERSEVSADNAAARQRELRQTQFVDTVQGAQAAGINPYFALGAGAQGPSAAPQGSSHPASGTAPASGAPALDTLLNVLFAGQRFKLTRAEIKTQEEQARNIAADTAKKEAETEGQRLSNQWIDRLSAAEEASKQAAASLDRNRVQEVYAKIREADSAVTKNLAEASTAESRILLQTEQAMLARANAWNVVALTPYMQAELEARTEQEHAAARQAAVAAAYQQGLIDSGMIEAVVRQTNASASVDEIEHSLRSYTDALNRGDTSQLFGRDPGGADKVVGALYKGLRDLSRSVLGK